MISIAIPVYKKKFLKEAIQSILNQTHTDFELIIINDASPDDIDNLVAEFKDERIRYYKNDKNLGKQNLTENWNKCLNYSRGEYFVLAADDDTYERDFLNEMLNLAKSNLHVDLFHCRVRTIDEHGSVISFTPAALHSESIYDFMWHRFIALRLSFVGDFMCRTDKLKSLGGFVNFPMAWSSDVATWLLLARDSGVIYSPGILFNYRYSNEQITKRNLLEEKVRAMRKFNEWMQIFLRKLEPKNKTEKEMLKEVETNLPQFIEKSYLNAFINGRGDVMKRETLIILNWIRLRKDLNLSLKFLFAAILKLIKENE